MLFIKIVIFIFKQMHILFKREFFMVFDLMTNELSITDMHYTVDTDPVFLDKQYERHRQEQADLVYLFQFTEEYLD